MDLRNIYDIYKEIDFEKKIKKYCKNNNIDEFTLTNFIYNLTSDFYGVVIEDFIKTENRIKESEEREHELKNIINENNCALNESVKTILADNKFKVDSLYRDKSNGHTFVVKELGTIKDIVKEFPEHIITELLLPSDEKYLLKNTTEENKQEKLANYVGMENIKTRSWQLGINDSATNYSYTTIQNLAGEDIEIPIKLLFYGPQEYGKLFYDDEKRIFWMVEVNDDEYNGKRNELIEEFGEKFTSNIHFFVDSISKK